MLPLLPEALPPMRMQTRSDIFVLFGAHLGDDELFDWVHHIELADDGVYDVIAHPQVHGRWVQPAMQELKKRGFNQKLRLWNRYEREDGTMGARLMIDVHCDGYPFLDGDEDELRAHMEIVETLPNGHSLGRLVGFRQKPKNP